MTRSPSYPSVSLPRAVALAERIYSSAHRSAIDPETAYELMGFSGKTGASLSALAALKHYGLVEGRGDSLKVTDLAERIFNPLTDDEKLQALQESAQLPEFFAMLNQEFGDKLPAENVIKSIAIRKHGFSQSGAEGVAKSYAETLHYLKGLGVTVSPRRSSDSEVSETAVEPQMSHIDTRLPTREITSAAAEIRPASYGSPSSTSSGDIIEVPLTRSVRARVIFDGKINAGHIDRLINILQTLKGSYEDEEEAGE